MHTILDNIFASISEAAVHYDFPKAYKLVQVISLSHASIKAFTHRLLCSCDKWPHSHGQQRIGICQHWKAQMHTKQTRALFRGCGIL